MPPGRKRVIDWRIFFYQLVLYAVKAVSVKANNIQNQQQLKVFKVSESDKKQKKLTVCVSVRHGVFMNVSFQ